MKAIANVYTKHKADLILLMNEYHSGITKDTTHSAIITDLKYLIDNSEEFCEDLDELMIKKKIITEDYQWNNALDPVGAIAGAAAALFGTVGKAISTVGARKQLELTQDIESDRFFHNYLLNEQNKSNGGKILLISGITFLVIAASMFFILRKRKK